MSAPKPAADEPGRSASGPAVGVQSLERALELLDLMADAGGELSLSQLAVASGLPVPTIHRLARTLVKCGYMRQLPSRRYALGARLIRLGDSASRMLADWARPHLAGLVDSIGETANMAVLDGDRAVYVAQVPSRHSMRMFTEVGRRVFVHCTGVGKVLLAQLPPQQALDIVRRTGMPAQTEHTITDETAFAAELAAVRDRGYAIDDGEQEIGVRCVAVPVPRSPSLTAISISGPEARLPAETVERVVPLLTAAADVLASELANAV